MRGSAKVLEGEAVIGEEMLVSREGRDGSCELEEEGVCPAEILDKVERIGKGIDVFGEIKGERTVVCTEGN
jgi:hypothetical protein